MLNRSDEWDVDIYDSAGHMTQFFSIRVSSVMFEGCACLKKKTIKQIKEVKRCFSKKS
jgi:hypothetical protein